MAPYLALGWLSGENPRGTAEWQQVTGWRPESLRKPGLAPTTIVDVGAGSGTPPLYAAFPSAYRVMIDPLSEHQQDVEHGEFIVTAVGDEIGTATIELGQQSLEHSTMAGLRGVQAERRSVPVTTLDALWEDRAWKPPFGLKVDAEGYEDRVVRGASRLLTATQFVIAEVQVAPRFRDGYSVAEFLSLLDSRGFVLRDIIDGHKGQENRGMHFMDCLFVRT
jgi:FkbM family methyltransferase